MALQTKSTEDPPSTTEERKAVGFTGPVDSVYLDTAGYVELDVGTGAQLLPLRSWIDFEAVLL